MITNCSNLLGIKKSQKQQNLRYAYLKKLDSHYWSLLPQALSWLYHCIIRYLRWNIVTNPQLCKSRTKSGGVFSCWMVTENRFWKWSRNWNTKCIGKSNFSANIKYDINMKTEMCFGLLVGFIPGLCYYFSNNSPSSPDFLVWLSFQQLICNIGKVHSVS